MAGTTTKSKMTARKSSDLRDLLIQYNTLIADFNTRALESPAPVIKTGGSALAKTGATKTICLVGGALVNIAAGTDLTALTGLTITANAFNVVIWSTDSAGTVIANFGTEGATAAAVVMPTLASGQCAFAGAYITHSSTFTGGTTALDTATTVYFLITGSWYPQLQAAKIGNLAGTAVSATAG